MEGHSILPPRLHSKKRFNKAPIAPVKNFKNSPQNARKIQEIFRNLNQGISSGLHYIGRIHIKCDIKNP